MRVLVTGARGMLGTDLLNEWTSDELIPSSSADADLRDFPKIDSLVRKVQPDWIVNCAAYTDVDGCERNRELAMAVNSDGVKHLAIAASSAGSRILHVSTDYVFNGMGLRPYEANDSLEPINVYGISKAAGEAALQQNHSAWCIARTSWLFGVHGPSFPEKILNAVKTRPELSVVNDQTGSPTYTRDLARAIKQLIHKNARGIAHVTNEGVCTWYDFAREILIRSGLGSIPVHPISTDQSARPARRPSYSVLSPASLHGFGIRTRPWQDALDDFLREKETIAS